MSVTLTSTPFKVAWAKNRNSYKMSCSTLVSSGTGGIYYVTRAAAIPSVGNHVVVNIDGEEYVFTIVASNPGAFEMATNDDLFNKIRACWYVKQVFGIPLINNDTTHLSLVVSNSRHYFDIYCTDADGNRTGYEGTMLNWFTSAGFGPGYKGTDPVYLKNYAVAVQLQVVVNNYNELKIHTIDGLVYQPDADGNIEVPLDMLGGLIPQPDLPSTDNTVATWEVLTNMLMKYYINYGEMWGDDKPLIQNWTRHPSGNTNYLYALCGEEAERFSRLNLNDWDSSAITFSETNSIFRIIGEEWVKTSRVCRSQAYYVYGMWFDPTVALTNTQTVAITVTKDGGIPISVDHTVNNGEVYRINLGPTALGIGSSVKYYNVEIGIGLRKWSHTFFVQPDFYGATEMMVQNKYGLMQSLVVPQVRREVVTEADEMNADRRRYLDITENSELYTATTAPMSRDEARRLAICLGQQYHYVKSGTAWLRVTIEAGSFTVYDDAEDMVRVEFQYRFTENQSENITAGSLSRSTTHNLVDFDDNLVSFTERTTPTENEIL